jgi:hypothetical protein
MKVNEVYNRLQEEIMRLYNPVREQIPQFIMQVYELYIAPHLERLPLTKEEKGYVPTPLIEALNNDEVLLQTIKVIGLMEASDKLEDFKELADKNTKRKKKKKDEEYQLTDFDKLLKVMLDTPNPNKGKKKAKK